MAALKTISTLQARYPIRETFLGVGHFMTWLKQLLRRSRALRGLVSLFRFLRQEVWFAAWSRIAPKRFMDQAHVQRSWDFESAVSQEWHNRVLAAIATATGAERWGDAIEIGCSEGVFTSYLATRCRSVNALDISPIAQARAAERCAQYPNVRIGSLDLVNGQLSGKYDLVFAMDVLSCIRGRRRLTIAAAKLKEALRDGGLLIYTDNSMPLDIQRSWGRRPWWGRLLAMMEPEDCVRFLQREFHLQLVHWEQYISTKEGSRDQSIALFRHEAASRGPGEHNEQGIQQTLHAGSVR